MLALDSVPGWGGIYTCCRRVGLGRRVQLVGLGHRVRAMSRDYYTLVEG